MCIPWLSEHSRVLPNLSKLSCLTSCSKLCSATFKILLKQKLIAQCYDGASVMSDQHRGVENIVKEEYPIAHYVYCYAHQRNLILQKAVSQITIITVFFAKKNAFSVCSLTLQREHHSLMIV